MWSELNEMICINGKLTLVRRLGRAVDLNIEVSEVVLVRDSTDTWDTISRAVLGCDVRAQDRTLVSGTDNLRFGHEPFCLFNDTLWKSHFGILMQAG
jgi:hypothetical protein